MASSIIFKKIRFKKIALENRQEDAAGKQD